MSLGIDKAKLEVAKALEKLQAEAERTTDNIDDARKGFKAFFDKKTALVGGAGLVIGFIVGHVATF
jgi:hypothetical protein